MDIKKAISDFENSDTFAAMHTGWKYYDFQNTDIMARKKLMYARDTNGQDYLIEDPYKANHKLASGYFKLLVDQKVQYSLGKGPNIRTTDQTAAVTKKVGPGTPPVTIDVDKQLGPDFLRVLRRTAKAAAIRSVGWAQPYVDTAGAFRLMFIPSQQVIPVYAEDDADQLVAALRYYPTTAKNKHGEDAPATRVEVWTATEVTVYLGITGEEDYTVLEESRPHVRTRTVLNGQTVGQGGWSWGVVPLVPLYNNDDRINDLRGIKRYIDVYDLVESDFANNLSDIQDVYWVLKGYDGTNMNTFLNEVRKYKTLKVAEEGDARAETIDIPTEARSELLNRLNDDIFKFGRGFDPSKTGDGNITNVVIKSRYANLELKAAEFEAQLIEHIDRLVDLLNVYLVQNGGQKIPDYDITFNHTQIMNEAELLTANAGQVGSISEETRLSHHPWVDDVFSEQQRVEAEKAPINLTPPTV